MAFARILVGVDLHQGDRVAGKDLSPQTHAAIEQAILLAAHSGGSITLCSSLDLSAQTATLIEQDHRNLLRTVEDIAAERLEELVEAVKKRGVSVDKVVRFGPADEQLSLLALEGHYDLLIVGTRSRSATTRLLFGSTAQRLVRTAPCAVWIVKPDELRDIREIAVATDLSESSRPGLAAAVDVARALSAKLFVLHIVDTTELSTLLMAGVSGQEISTARTRMLEDSQATLQQQLSATDYRTLPYGVKVEIIEGIADDAIAQFVIDNEIDILIVGTHGRRGISRLILGNTVERILPQVHCSVIAVKPADFVSPYAHQP